MTVHFPLTTADERAAWESFRAAHPDVSYRDALGEQAEELFAIERPDLEPGTPAFVSARRLFVQERSAPNQGVWIFYEWRRLAVRILPRQEFLRVRTARNRNIITAEAQQRYRDCVVGIAGLSLGNAIAQALVLTGGGGRIVIADQDTLALSNLNRLLSGVPALGENKAVLTARQLLELDPYVEVTLLPQGVRDEALGAFFNGPPRLDVVVDAVDSMTLKWKLRDEARRRGVPVLMSTCMGERILLDVERYDKLPNRRLFVRKVGDDFLERVSRPLSRTAWIAAATEIVGVDETDPLVKATNDQVGKTMTTRPLLGGTVEAAGAIVARAIRHIATGAPLADGRHRIDLAGTPPDAPPAAVVQRALPWDMTAWERALARRPAAFWEERGARQALALFHRVARRVPAYRDFLAKHGVSPEKIRTIEDFSRHVPPVDKDNYLRRYSLAELCLDGNPGTAPMISVSSGSTGVPYFWPRGEQLTAEGAFVHEFMFRQSFGIDRGRTLVIVAFSMGTWIAGTYTTECVRMFARRDYSLNVATPGIEIQDILPIIEALHGSVDRIVLAGYPPLVKDIMDAVAASGIAIDTGKFRFLFAGEGFTEEWRAALLARFGIEAPCAGSASIYGTADAGVMGHETPYTVAARRFLSAHPAAAEELFGDERLPTIVQTHPAFKHVEVNERQELLFTTDAGIPLIRYNIHDIGGRFGFDDFAARLAELGGDPAAMLAEEGHQLPPSRLPFVYLFGRKQLATTVYAVNIYLENIQAALADPDVRLEVSGKSVMGNANDAALNQYWWISIEAARGVAPHALDAAALARTVTRVLCERNSEFRRLYAAIGERVMPKVSVLPFGSPEFRVKTKLRWAAKPSNSPTS